MKMGLMLSMISDNPTEEGAKALLDQMHVLVWRHYNVADGSSEMKLSVHWNGDNQRLRGILFTRPVNQGFQYDKQQAVRCYYCA